MDARPKLAHRGWVTRFAYYQRLSKADQRIYRLSDEYDSVELDAAAQLHPIAASIGRALQAEDRVQVERACQDLSRALCVMLNVPSAEVRVHAARPSDEYGELHGLYTPDEERALVEVWMRTAAQGQVVAHRTFLRTLLHELVHHLDYELLDLEDSFHTEGFFQRESSLMRQVMAAGNVRPCDEDGTQLSLKL